METKHRLPYWLAHDAAPELQEACEKDPATSEDAEWIVPLLLHPVGVRGGIEDWLDCLQSKFVEVSKASPARPIDCPALLGPQLEVLEVVMPMADGMGVPPDCGASRDGGAGGSNM